MRRLVAVFPALVAATLCLAQDAREPDPSPTGPVRIMHDPSIPTCPTSNCPLPPRGPVLSSQWIHGKTTKGRDQHEWLSNIGLLVGTGSPDGQKVAQYIGAMQVPGGGTAWALNTDSVRNATPGGRYSMAGFEGSGVPGQPGAMGRENGTIGYELDFTNWDQDSAPGQGPFTVGQYVHAQGSFTSLAAIYFDAKMARGSRGWHDGLLFNGDNVIRQNTISDFTHSHTSLTIGGQHVMGVNTSQANADLHAIVMRPGQTACFNGVTNCVSWRDGKLVYLDGQGRALFSVDDQGNTTFRGRVTENAEP